ncbi:hypothetical protein [Nocardiopsis synnemataformans]|uniref:hypothetical protein n=1 Tax=Nocardiopsis synnemataformans TaxID=61305 RepID=UPI003EBF535C
MATHTRVHTNITHANPHLRCDECGAAVTGWHNPDPCGCDTTFWNVPCGCVRADATNTCPSWSPIDGCLCPEVLGAPSHEIVKES